MQIVLQTPAIDTTGYSRSLRGLALGLYLIGANVKIDYAGGIKPKTEFFDDREKALLDLVGKQPESDRMTIIHRAACSFEKFQEPTIGSTYWETDRLPDSWIEKCNQMDMLFLASRNNIDVFNQSGVNTRIAHVRNGIFPDAYLQPGPQFDFPVPRLPEFKFLSVFQWNYRKGYDILLRSFLEEFSRDEDVCLIIKTCSLKEEIMSSGYILNWIKHLSGQFRHDKSATVYAYSTILKEQDLISLYKSCQAFVLPSRGEGLGLPYLEAAAGGLPIIATGWGGQMDFLTENNAYLVDYHLTPVTPQWFTPYYQPDQKWAEPSVKDLRQQMRMVYDNYTEARQKAYVLQREILTEYTWEKAALDVATAISQLTGKSIL